MSGLTNEEDRKPAGDQGAHINLKVKGQDGNEVFFRIKRSTQLKKLMNAYCDRQSVELNSIAFLFDGRRLRAEQTPDEDGSEVYFRMNRSTQLKKLLIAFCDRKSIPHNVVTFLFAGRPFRREQTPDELKMEEGDEIKAIFHQTVEQRLYFDQLVAETIALEEEVIRLRKDYEEEGGLLIRIRRVKRVVSKLIADDSALREELTRVRKDEEEEDGVFLKMGRLLTERIADSSALREKLSRLWKDEEEDNEEEEDEEDDEEEEDDTLFMEIGKIIFEVLDKSG